MVNEFHRARNKYPSSRDAAPLLEAAARCNLDLREATRNTNITSCDF